MAREPWRGDTPSIDYRSGDASRHLLRGSRVRRSSQRDLRARVDSHRASRVTCSVGARVAAIAVGDCAQRSCAAIARGDRARRSRAAIAHADRARRSPSKDVMTKTSTKA
jgi:hypothetical protein